MLLRGLRRDGTLSASSPSLLCLELAASNASVHTMAGDIHTRTHCSRTCRGRLVRRRRRLSILCGSACGCDWPTWRGGTTHPLACCATPAQPRGQRGLRCIRGLATGRRHSTAAMDGRVRVSKACEGACKRRGWTIGGTVELRYSAILSLSCTPRNACVCACVALHHGATPTTDSCVVNGFGALRWPHHLACCVRCNSETCIFRRFARSLSPHMTL